MGLRLFADQCVPTTVTTFLRDAGYEVLCLRDFLPIESVDSVVISKAQELNAILISLNGDFARAYLINPIIGLSHFVIIVGAGFPRPLYLTILFMRYALTY